MEWLEERGGCIDVPRGAKTFLGFPCATGRGVGDLAHAGDVGFGGCEIASKQVGEVVSIDCLASVHEDEGGKMSAYPPVLSCSLSAIVCCSVLYCRIMIAMRLYRAADVREILILQDRETGVLLKVAESET